MQWWWPTRWVGWTTCRSRTGTSASSAPSPDVACDCYIDDAPHNVKALRAAGNEVICFGQPYNTDIAQPRMDNWVEVEDYVLNLAADGGHQVQIQLPGFPVHVDRLASVQPNRADAV
nr:hypothetical protein [Candidatus Microthrix sp.]